MRRPNNILTPISVFFTVLALSAVLVAYLLRGGTLFSPGPLTAKAQEGVTLGGYESHADFEAQCSLCHQPLTSDLATKCLECHIQIDRAIKLGDDLHATLVDPYTCAGCHRDHLGTEFDPTIAARLMYDHNLSGFSLIHHQLDYEDRAMECESCHNPKDFVINEVACKECHTANAPEFMAQHMNDFSLACLQCHNGYDRMANFDHAETTFPLRGMHLEIRCGACHAKGNFDLTNSACAQCHQEPDIHLDLFGTVCQDCHTEASWAPAMLEVMNFDHNQNTGFSLIKHARDFHGSPITCVICHQNQSFSNFYPQICIDCHMPEQPEYIQNHTVDFGLACTTCHNGADRMTGFDHNLLFPLTGRHAELTCQGCHANQVFSGTPTDCVNCHAEPAIHAGSFGKDCARCHQTSAWTPAQLREHVFPIDHGSDLLSDCQTCHLTTYMEYTCYQCHEHDPADIQEEHVEEGISVNELGECAVCHPTGQEED
jgi:hypothetical protein